MTEDNDILITVAGVDHVEANDADLEREAFDVLSFPLRRHGPSETEDAPRTDLWDEDLR